MNKPDENTLKSWLEGELEGAELQQVEAWAELNASDLDKEFKCNIGWDALSDDCFASLPDSVEPPYPEFFNSKIQQSIQADEVVAPEAIITEPSLWSKLRGMLLPAAIAACAAFYAGTLMNSSNPSQGDVATTEGANYLYLPNDGVVATVADSADATEIVLNGLTPISDELDIASADTEQDDSPFMMANSVRDAIYYF